MTPKTRTIRDAAAKQARDCLNIAISIEAAVFFIRAAERIAMDHMEIGEEPRAEILSNLRRAKEFL